jgi:hypothetical protein
VRFSEVIRFRIDNGLAATIRANANRHGLSVSGYLRTLAERDDAPASLPGHHVTNAAE